MKHYIDITLLPDADIALYFLWEKVYQQVHLALVESQQRHKKNLISVGAAFPEYDTERFQLGRKLRLLAVSTDELERLNIKQWLSRLQDYVHITSIREVPEKKIEGYVHFKRLQPKSNNDRLVKRHAERKAISVEEAAIYFMGRKEVYSRAPFVRINSHSSGKRYRLLILRSDAETSEKSGGFSSYGLSSTRSVPVF
jgi:CRISPR-associated endonuclease Csy4